MTTVTDERPNIAAASKLASEHGWILLRSEAELVPAYTVGGPTNLRVTVQLAPASEMPNPDVMSTGEGTTHVEAVRNALGL